MVLRFVLHVKLLGLLAAAALLLTACGRGGPDTNPPEPNPSALSGRIQNWSGGEGVLEAQVFGQDEGSYGPHRLASGTVGSDGEFSLTLPDTVSDVFLIDIGPAPEDCGAMTISAPSARMTFIAGLEASRDGATLGTVVQASTGTFDYGPPASGTVVVARLYSDRAVSVGGRCSSPFLGADVTFDLTLRAGWNVVFAEVTAATESSVAVSIKSGRLPAGVDWYIHLAPAPLPPPPAMEPVIDYVGADPSDVDDLTVTFRWQVYDPSGSMLNCSLDPGDGTPAYLIADCAETTTQDHRYGEPGEYVASFWVSNDYGAGDGREFPVFVGIAEE